jgi:hypothetical protein
MTLLLTLSQSANPNCSKKTWTIWIRYRLFLLRNKNTCFIMNGVGSIKKPGSGMFNANEPFGNNPWIQIPPDVDRNPFRLVRTVSFFTSPCRLFWDSRDIRIWSYAASIIQVVLNYGPPRNASTRFSSRPRGRELTLRSRIDMDWYSLRLPVRFTPPENCDPS